MGEMVKSRSLSSQYQRSSWKKKILSNFFRLSVFMLIFVPLFSCNNLNDSTGRRPTSIINFADPATDDSGGSFTLLTVLPSQKSPGTLFDLIGQNGEFDTYCNSGLDGSCQCEYTYTEPGTTTQTTVAGAINEADAESNLLRCVNEIPAGIESVLVRIATTGSVRFVSNQITVSLASGSFSNSTNYIDLSQEAAYTPVKRFQCRRRSFIPNPLDNNIIDPIQSEDPKIIYPFNFYTTNVADSLWNLQQLNNQDWDCTLSPTHDHSLHWWANPLVFSASTCAATGDLCAADLELMYPMTALSPGKVTAAAGEVRSSFHLAKQPYSVFQIPLKAAVGPNTFVSSKVKVIGYAARPIPDASGSSACPSITLPTGARWMKLWNFRATDITPPKYIEKTNATEISGVACNPATGVFPSCDTPISFGGAVFGKTLAQITGTGSSIIYPAIVGQSDTESQTWNGANNGLASRVVVLDSAIGNLNACYNVRSMGRLLIEESREVWHPSNFAFSTSVSLAMMKGLPWELYNPAALVCSADAGPPVQPTRIHNGGACNATGANYDLWDGDPGDSQLTLKSLGTENYSDQLFVVTDADVNDTLMRNQSSSVSHFKPVTYRTATDCAGPSRAACLPSRELHWDINVKEIKEAASATDPDMFPLCVLQFED